MSMQVVKFGGTSMGSASAMRQAAQIVARNRAAKFVVVSATSGTTNQLLQANRSAISGSIVSLADILGGLRHRHLEIAAGLEMQDLGPLDDLLQGLEAQLAIRSGSLDRDLDAVLSFGERLSAVLFSAALKNAGLPSMVVDASQLLVTDSRFGKAEPKIAETKEQVDRIARPLLAAGNTIVTQGFLGADQQGSITTLGRGGSDFSAAIFSEALHAEACQIWTDVNGIYSMDPRVVPNARLIPEITFGEAAELANFGAKVLHPATLLPALRAGVKVFVGNTFSPEAGGTWIYPELKERPLVRAIAVRNHQTLITVSSMRMLNSHGFLARLFAILADQGLSVDLVTTSEVSVALTIDGTSSGSSGRSILENISLMEQLRHIAEVQVEDNLSLVALVGNRLSSTPGVAARAFQAVGLENVRLICHGASANNMCFLVSSPQVNRVASRLHEAFL